jgi:regulator of protease activity HflC (stomatin/prohibitin superfamily)
MLGIRYFKTVPTTYVIHYSGGRTRRKGLGMSFFYFAPTATLVQVSQASIDVPFVFEETTNDFQDVTLQGQLTYRVTDPEKLTQVLDYSIDPYGRYKTDDPEKLKERLVQAIQVYAHSLSQTRSLETIMTQSSELSSELLSAMRSSETTQMLGIEILALSILSVKASPEIAKAMQADTREKLLTRADESLSARRNAAIELERLIKENELRTERIVEEKRREVRQAQMQADVAIETQRAELVEQQGANNRKLAQVQAETLRETLDAMKGTDWKTLMAATGGQDSKNLIAIAFNQIAENAQNIGRLDITPDLLNALIDSPKKK